MPITLREVFTKLAAKANVKMDDENLVNALSAPDLDKLTVPDDFFTSLDNNLLSLDAAKGDHPDIKNYYTAQVLDRVDKDILALAQENKLPDDAIAELKSEKSSYKRVGLLTRKLADAHSKKASAGNVDKEKYAKEIADLNEAIRLEKEKAGQIEATWQQKLLDKDMMNAKRAIIAQYKTTFDHLSPQAREAMLDSLINFSLKEKNYKLSVDDSGKMLLLREDGSKAFGENHQELTAKSFFDKVLSDNKVLVVNDQNANQQRGGANQQQNNGSNGNNNYVPPKKTANSGVQALNEQAIREMENADQVRLV